MPNSISIHPTSIAERQHISARQLASLNKNANLASGDSSLDTAANAPAYILDLSDPSINRAANQLQSTSPSQDSKIDLGDSPAYIVDISSKSIRMAKEQKAVQKDEIAPKTLLSSMQ
ncbi:MAG: hypothetical protein LLG02_13690 [Pelosinus sp.]|nr:hypothetical protein [Pelosinus sp.]